MALKQLLGLEACGLSDEEIMRRIQEAKQQRLQHISFPANAGEVTLKLSGVDPVGVMWGNFRLYKNRW